MVALLGNYFCRLVCDFTTSSLSCTCNIYSCKGIMSYLRVIILSKLHPNTATQVI